MATFECLLRDLYDSEINFSISSFWDGGYTVRLGDDMNGFEETRNVETIQEAATFLRESALKHYPRSKYALAHPAGAQESTCR